MGDTDKAADVCDDPCEEHGALPAMVGDGVHKLTLPVTRSTDGTEDTTTPTGEEFKSQEAQDVTDCMDSVKYKVES